MVGQRKNKKGEVRCMVSNGFIKGAVFGMLASAAVATAMMPKKTAISKRSTIGKGIKFVGDIADSVSAMMH